MGDLLSRVEPVSGRAGSRRSDRRGASAGRWPVRLSTDRSGDKV